MKKLITSALIPPGIFIIIFILCGLYAKRKIVTIMSFLCALLLYAISIEPVKDMLYYPLEKKVKAIVTVHTAGVLYKNSIDAIVILGGGVYENSNFKEDSSNRLLAGYILYSMLGKPLILSGGSAGGNMKEGYTMYALLQHFNVKKEDIIIEGKSRDTDDNANNVIQICKKKHFTHIALVTSAYHMQRALKHFSKSSIEIIPILCDSKLDMHYTIYSFLPTFSSFANSSKALREHLALMALCIAGE